MTLPHPADTAVLAEGLQKRYGDVAALAGVDVAIRHGEVFALLGPNGAGKTTTVEILEGYRHRDGGTAAVLGEDHSGPDERGAPGSGSCPSRPSRPRPRS